MPENIQSELNGLIGTCYYPEIWDRNMCLKDLKLMKENGISCVRIAEFAWGIIEPSEGVFDFRFFDEVLDICEKLRMTVIMCTPTAAVPAWLVKKYPEVMKWNIQRQPLAYGSRKDLSYSSRIFIKLCKRIVRKMAEHFKDRPCIIGWQVDNEINCGSYNSYSPEDTLHFRKFLKIKYENISALNKAWGTNFWSQQYNAWHEVELPGKSAETGNPSQLLDEKYFISWQVSEFVKHQVKILKSLNKKWLITHNGAFANVDLDEFQNNFDVFSHDQYPLFYKNWREATFNMSRIRGHCGKFWIMEQQAGPGGKPEYLQSTPEPGQIRLWTWQSFAHGANLILYFQWRTHPYGAEQRWHGILDHDNKRNRRLSEIKSISEDIKGIPTEYWTANVDKKIALIWDYVNMSGDAVFSDVTISYEDIKKIYCRFVSMGLPVDIISNNTDFNDYSVLIDLHPRICHETHVKRLENFVMKGGKLLLAASAGIRNLNGHMRCETPPGPYSKLAGLHVSDWTKVSKEKVSLILSGEEIPAECFAEALEPETAQVVAKYKTENLVLKNKPAICHNKLGKGDVIYYGTYLNETPDFFVDFIIEQFHLSVLRRLSEGLEVSCRGNERNEWISILNHNRGKIKIPLKNITGKKIVSSYLDAILKEKTYIELKGYGIGILEIRK